MPTVRELHNKAMELLNIAIMKNQENNYEMSKKLLTEAFEYEYEATKVLDSVDKNRKSESSEPTRSILYQSTASLAMRLEDYSTAINMIHEGLRGFPPLKIRDKLFDLLQEALFLRNLDEVNLKLSPDDMHLAMEGKFINSGMMPYIEFGKKLDSFTKIIHRSTQYLTGKEYKPTRIPKKDILITPYISVPQYGSFAVDIKFVVPSGTQLRLDVTTENIIDHIMNAFDLLNNDKIDMLKSFYKQQDAYFTNFISLSKDIAPDGEIIKRLGLSTKRKTINFSRNQNEIKTIKSEMKKAIEMEEQKKEYIKVEGILNYADSRYEGKETIMLLTDQGEERKIIVKEGMEDVVRNNYKLRVRVEGESDGKDIYLDEIKEVDED